MHYSCLVYCGNPALAQWAWKDEPVPGKDGPPAPFHGLNAPETCADLGEAGNYGLPQYGDFFTLHIYFKIYFSFCI